MSLAPLRQGGRSGALFWLGRGGCARDGIEWGGRWYPGYRFDFKRTSATIHVSATKPDAACRKRTRKFAARVLPLPGALPYVNRRPMSVTGAFDRSTLLEFLVARHPHVGKRQWLARVVDGLVEVDARAIISPEHRVRAGNAVVHVMPDTVEPEVSTDVRVLHEDTAMIVLHKPAPLAVHPCGRYNRNSLTKLLEHCFPGEAFLPVHRLDADTAGLLVLAKSRAAARNLSQQFERREVDKVYLALVHGQPTSASFDNHRAISPRSAGTGKRHVIEGGQPASTRFEVLASVGEASLVLARPSSGRTNQIRVHLADLGQPVVGDQAYSGKGALISGTEPLCLHAWRLQLRHPTTGQFVSFEDHPPAWAQPFVGSA